MKRIIARMLKALLFGLMIFGVAEASSKSSSMWNWFDGHDVDYWNEGKEVKDYFHFDGSGALTGKNEGEKSRADKVTEGLSGSPRDFDSVPFDWLNYENPEHPVFWDDGGDYVPPRPLRMLAADPSQENVDRYLAWQTRKNAVTAKLTSMVTANMSTSAVRSSRPEQNQQKIEMKKPLPIDYRKLKIVFIYKSSCPYCQQQVPVLEELRRRGAKIESYQIDHREHEPIMEFSKPYGASIAERYPVEVTPTMYVSYKNQVQILDGFMEINTILEGIKK